jgi:steroid delta-isomerase-like uncharacterized protein
MSVSAQQLVTDLIAAWNSHDPERIAALYAPEYEESDVAQADSPRGRDGIRRTASLYLRAFPDLQVTLNELVVEGDRAALAWHWRGTHQGTFMRIPPSGRCVTVRGTSFLTIENGQITRGTRIWDLAGLLRAIGLLPEL